MQQFQAADTNARYIPSLTRIKIECIKFQNRWAATERKNREVTKLEHDLEVDVVKTMRSSSRSRHLLSM